MDLVAMGTIADIAPLVGENRYLVKQGLKLINTAPRLGVRQMITQAGLSPGSLDAGSISWILAPRLNAAGRLAHAMTSYRLLMTDSPKEAQGLAIWLEQKNAERQRLTEKALARAREQVSAQETSPLLIASGKDYPVGIAGLVASKLSEEFYRPAIVIRTGEQVSSGSCRSIAEFNVILCNSRFTESIVKKLDKNIDTRVIYPGVDYDLFSKDQVSNGEKYFFNQSWLTSQKNHMFLLQLAKKIDSKFLICGLFDFRMKKRKPMLDKMMNEKSDNVEFILNPAEGTTVKYLKNSYVYLSSSLNEGFGLSILEAMACGKPVIAMNSGGHNEVVGDSGILCASDISSWIEECKDLISNTSRYDELAERGKARAKEYNWERTTDNILSILES